MAKTSLKNLQTYMGYHFRNRQTLLEALTHSSYARESSRHARDNERLEFLGDAVLNFLVSVRLADTFPQYNEGSLSRARARLVGAEHLAKIAVSLDLGKYLRLGRGEKKTGGQTKAALLADALEALVAAVYRDGSLESAQEFIDRFIVPRDLAAHAQALLSADYKSALQEYLQGKRMVLGKYHVVKEEGPEHQKIFTVEVTAGAEWRARGNGTSKKAAEQQAARNLLEAMASCPEPQ